MALYEFTKTAITKLDETTFAAKDINERLDLQRLLKQHINVIAREDEDLLIIAEEFCEWDGSKRRIDLVAIDQEANVVVIELKRTEDGGHMELQAIRYAAMISAMSFSEAVEIYGRYLQQIHSNENAETSLLDFLGWEVANEGTFGQKVQIILVSAAFSKEITTSVLWLNEYNLDIRCVRLRPYSIDSRIILDVQQVIPLPEAESMLIRYRRKVEENRQAERLETGSSKYDLTIDGNKDPNLGLGELAYKVVKAALVHGLTAEQVFNILPPRKSVSVPGEHSAIEFQAEVSTRLTKRGSKYQLSQFFCDDDELFRQGGKTYALSKKWTAKIMYKIDNIVAELPPGSVSYSNAAEVI